MNDINLLNKNNKDIIEKYFDLNKYNILFENKENILNLKISNWGDEKIYIIDNDININKIKQFYNIQYNDILNIYNIAISVQIGNWEVFLNIEKYLENFKNINVNIYFIIIYEISNLNNINYIINKYKNICIISCENRGMDIGLFLVNLHYIKIKKYNHDYIFKIHTKTNDDFRNICLNNLMKDHNKIIENIQKLSNDLIGIISANTIYNYKNNKHVFNNNMYYLKYLSRSIYYEDIDYNKLEFSAGTMFIAKLKIFHIFNLRNIEYIYFKLNNYDTLDYYWYSIFYNIDIKNKKNIFLDYYLNKNNKYPNNLSYSYNTNNPGYRDSMLEHAIERFFGYICKKYGLYIIY